MAQVINDKSKHLWKYTRTISKNQPHSLNIPRTLCTLSNDSILSVILYPEVCGTGVCWHSLPWGCHENRGGDVALAICLESLLAARDFLGTFWWPDQHLKINWLVLGRGNMGEQTEDTSRHPVLAVAIWGVVNWVKRTVDTYGSWHPLILECWKLHLNTLWNQPLTHTGDLEGWYEGYIGLSRQ